jgi:hypothetical protein
LTTRKLHSSCTRIEFPVERVEAQRQTLERLYERKATLEALIQSLEEYTRCRASGQVTPLPEHGY